MAVLRETIRGSYETNGCMGRVARCCLSRCHRHVFGSHNVHMRNKKARRHSRQMKKGTRHLFSKFHKAMDRGMGEVKAHHVEEVHDKSLGILNERVVKKRKNSHRRLEKRLATRRTSVTVRASKMPGGPIKSKVEPLSEDGAVAI